MELLTGIILAAVGGGTLTAVVTAYLFRRREELNNQKTSADVLFVTAQTEETAVSTRKSETAYYQDLVDKLVPKLEKLERAQDDDKREREADRKESVIREASLHEKIDGLTRDLAQANTALTTANSALATANETISSLRDKVEGLQDKITELQDKITGLLVDRAEKK